MPAQRNRLKTMTLSALLLAACAAPALHTQAHAAEPDGPMALRGIMQELDQNMQAVTAAISLEDWARVAELAPRIADHAEPPLMEKVRILMWLGTDALQFRGFDKQAEDAAASMGEAAKRADGEAVISAFATVQRNCLACHQAFRKPFIENFYGRP